MDLVRKYLSSTNFILLVLILLLGVFFRIYKLEIFYPWGHDQDLFAWIAKDIIVDHHFRLIGQETSITGVFIGPMLYYLIAGSFAIFKMNPLSAVVVTNVISLLTIISFYWVFSKFFGKSTGLIGAFLYAVSPGTILVDRWVVPTQPTFLWAIWYLYVLLSILKGNMRILIPTSILIGLVWHVHIAFIPLLVLLPTAFVLSGKNVTKLKISLKSLLLSFVIFLLLMSPYFAFEIRHGFQQTKSLIKSTYDNRGDLTGSQRMLKVINSGGKVLAGQFVASDDVISLNPLLVDSLPFLMLVGIFYLWRCHILTRNQTILFICWYSIVFLGQFFSKRTITEYYFNNILILFFLILSLLLSKLNNFFKIFPVVRIILVSYLVVIMSWFIGRPDDLGGFLYKRKTIEYIAADALRKNYPCVAINYIENQPGGGTGFRYLFWQNKLNVITSGNDVPVYNIVNPWTISKNEINIRFGNMGIIVPSKKEMDPKICSDSNRQLLPLWGFNN